MFVSQSILWDAITHPYPDVGGSLPKLPLEPVHG